MIQFDTLVLFGVKDIKVVNMVFCDDVNPYSTCEVIQLACVPASNGS